MNEPEPTDKYIQYNHHHELTEKHRVVDFGDGEFVANVEAIPLLKALSDVGLKTRTHHISDDNEGRFFSILIEPNVDIEIRQVNEIHSSRSRYDGMTELLIKWRKH